MKRMIFALAVVLVATFMAPAIYAEGRGYDKGKGQHDDIGMFSKKAEMICGHKDELGLSDEQLEKIKSLKSATEKDLIKAKSEVDIITIDIKDEMRKDKINVEVVNALIDKKFDIKKEKAKSLVSAVAKLKETLTAEQITKLKTICGECGKGEGRKEKKY